MSALGSGECMTQRDAVRIGVWSLRVQRPLRVSGRPWIALPTIYRGDRLDIWIRKKDVGVRKTSRRRLLRSDGSGIDWMGYREN